MFAIKQQDFHYCVGKYNRISEDQRGSMLKISLKIDLFWRKINIQKSNFLPPFLKRWA